MTHSPSTNTAITPVTSLGESHPFAKNPRAALDHLAVSQRVVTIENDTILWYVKGKTGRGVKLTDRDYAMIVLRASGLTFKVQWYPRANEGEIQVLDGLPIARLPLIVADLIAAGFTTTPAYAAYRRKQDEAATESATPALAANEPPALITSP